MQFHMLRFSLLERLQMSLLSPPAPGPLPTREAWLRQVFGSELTFQYGSRAFYYEPTRPAAGEIATPIQGRIGRQVTARESAPPTEGLTPTERESWQSALVLIDPRPHDQDGQKVAFERTPTVGNPTPIFIALAEQLNLDESLPYIIEVAPISDEKDFWNFVARNRNDIVSVTFELFAPNGMFTSHEEFNRGMQEIKENEKARKVKVTLENLTGLNLDTPGVHAAAENAAQGGGAIRARTKSNLRFNSKSRVRGEVIDQGQEQSFGEFVRNVVGALFRQ